MRVRLLGFQRKLTRRLFAWSSVSISSGVLMQWRIDPLWKGLGIQFVAWGMVDALIALVGSLSTQKRMDNVDQKNPYQQEILEARKLCRLLWINTFLDILYMAGGLALIKKRERKDRYWIVQGWGIFLQGGFLYIFDLIHVLIMPKYKV